MAALVLAHLLLRIPAVGTFAANLVLGAFRVAPRATLGARDVRGDWLTRIDLRGVRAARGDTVLASADTLRLRLHPLALLLGRIELQRFEVSGLRVRGDLLAGPRSPAAGPTPSATDLLRGRFYRGPALRLERLAVRDAHWLGADSSGAVVDLAAGSLNVHDVALGGMFAWTLDSLALHLVLPRGEAHAETRVRARLSAGRLEIEELRLTSPRSDLHGGGILAAGAGDSLGEIRLQLRAAPLDLSDLSLVLGSPEAPLDGPLTADLSLEGAGPSSFSGTLDAAMTRATLWGARFESTRLAVAMTRGEAEVRLRGVAEGAGFAVTGRGRLLDPHPDWTLDASLPALPERLPGLAWWPALAQRAPSEVAVHASGRGFAGGVLSIDAEAAGDAGRLELRGGLDASNGLAWNVEALRFEDLDLARLAGDSTASRLNGALVARGARRSDGAAQLEARLELEPSRYGDRSLTSGRLRARLDGPRGGASGTLVLEGGVVAVDTFTWRMDGASPFRLEGGQIRGVDPGVLSGDSAWAGTLDLDVTLKGTGAAALAAAPLEALRTGRVTADAHVGLAPARVRGRTIHTGGADLALRGGEVRATAQLDSDAGRIAVRGTARPFDPEATWRIEEARFTALDAGAWAGVRGWTTDLAGRIEATGRAADRDRGAAGATALVRLERSRIGRLTIDDGDLRVEASPARTRIEGTLRARGTSLRVDAERIAGPSGDDLSARAELPLAVLAGLAGGDSASGDGLLRLEATVRMPPGDAAGATGTGTLRGAGVVGALRLDTLGVAVRLERGALRLDTLALHANAAEAAASGRIALTGDGASDLAGRIELRDLAPFAALLGADSLSMSGGSIDFSVSGPPRARILAWRGSVRAPHWNGTDAARLDADASVALDSLWRVTDARGLLEGDRILLAGLPVEQTHAELDYRGRELHFAVTSVRDAHYRARVAGRLSGDSTTRVLRLDTLTVDSRGTPWALARPCTVHIGPDRVEVDGLELRSDDGSVTADGAIDRRGTQSFQLELRNVGLDLLATWLGLDDLSGRVDGRLSLAGPAGAPRGEGTLDVGLTANRQAAGVLRSRLAWDGTGVDVGGEFVAAGGDSLSVSGRLPLVLSLEAPPPGAKRRAVQVFEGDVRLRFRADRFPVAELAPLLGRNEVVPHEGVMSMDARLEGTTGRLGGAGNIVLEEGAIDLTGAGIRLRDARLLAGFEGDRIVLRECRAHSGKGRIEASGSVRVAGLTRIEPDVTVKATRGVFVDRRDLRLLATGEIHLGGTLSDPVVRGRARIEDSHVLIDGTALAESRGGPDVELTPEDLRMLESHFTRVAPSAPDPAVAFYDATDLDLNLTFDRDTWVRQQSSPRLAVELVGEVRARKPPHGELTLEGRIEPVPGRGFVEQFGRSFDITGGEVLLNGRMEDHRVDVQTAYRARSQAPSSAESDVVVHLDVSGHVDQLSLTLSSEPSLSETEIVTYIATGRDPSAQGSTGTGRSDATALARDIGLSQMSSALEGAARSRIGLDVLQLRFDALQGATLVAGRYIDPSLYVGFRQPLQYQDNGGAQTGQEPRTRVELEYEAYRWLVLNLQGESSLLRSFIRVRHAY